MSIFDHSRFIWAEGFVASRNQFISFEQHVPRTHGGPVDLHLFADTRFRLWVNEVFVAYGPGRFVTQFPEYDSYDLAAYLTEEVNLVRVEVNYYGSSSYQSMPDGQPGFIAAGGSEEGEITFATPGDWQARTHSAWDAHAPHFSFAQNPAEICDTTVLASELQDGAQIVPVRLLSKEECPWGSLSERSAPYPKYATYEPKYFELAAALKPSRTYGLQSIQAESAKKLPKAKRAIATWIYSPIARPFTLGCFWSDIECNGKPVSVETDTPLGNHGEAVLPLKSGWNFVTILFETLRDCWSYLLRPEPNTQVSLHARPDLQCTAPFAASAISTEAIILPAHNNDCYTLPDGWSIESGDITLVTPARLTAWDTVDDSTARRQIPYSNRATIDTQIASEATWCVKFEKEYYGQAVIEVEAPSGTILDVAYDDWLRADSCVNLYVSNPFTDAADRFILRGGRQRIEVLNPRGGIYLQITLRAPDNQPVLLKLHQLYIQKRTTIDTVAGSFESGQSAFDYAWDASVNTLVASTDEAYSDCPWRERGSYIGDALVGFQLDRLCNSDVSVAKRTFLNFGRAALPNGQLPSCAPSWLRKSHEDFSLLWIIGIHDIWSATGDVPFIEENWPRILAVLDAPWETHSSGLWNTNGHHLFIDWGVLQQDRQGQGNASINIARFGALQAAAQMAGALGRDEEQSALKTAAATVRSALLKHLWNEDEQRFNASLSDANSPALHANIWALFFKVGDSTALLHYLEPHLRNNLEQGIEGGQASGHAELYFLYYVFTALGELGQHALIEQLIEDHYGFLADLNYGTLNECFSRAAIGAGSCCHTWSSAGAIYAHQYILGLRQLEDGKAERWILDPKTTGRFHSISGSMAHSCGNIEVSWKRVNGVISATVHAPREIVIEAGPQVNLKRINTESAHLLASIGG